jgi:LmbE family N-acetylglucosaminyl deacetylase
MSIRSKTPLTQEERREKKRRDRNRRVIAYGGIAVAAYIFYLWVPWELDFIPRQPPTPNPPLNPDTEHLFSPGTKVLVITAHPDDSAFYIGGFLHQLGQSGAEIHQVICTDGDKGYYGYFADPAGNRKIRRQEAIQELRAWGGKDVLFLGRLDGRLRADESLVKRLRAHIDVIQPEYVICFDGDYPPRMRHGDHRHSGVAAEAAAKGAPSVRWLMRFSTIGANFVRDISDDWEEQKKLLRIHASQFHGRRLEGVTNMVESGALEDGEKIGVTYGEGFRCTKLR